MHRRRVGGALSSSIPQCGVLALLLLHELHQLRNLLPRLVRLVLDGVRSLHVCKKAWPAHWCLSRSLTIPCACPDDTSSAIKNLRAFAGGAKRAVAATIRLFSYRSPPAIWPPFRLGLAEPDEKSRLKARSAFGPCALRLLARNCCCGSRTAAAQTARFASFPLFPHSPWPPLNDGESSVRNVTPAR